MSGPQTTLKAVLEALAVSYQDKQVIPHCSTCSSPCCRLDKLVLELEWEQVKALWHIEEPRLAFDRRLASGKGPGEIRAGNGFYYIHSKPCPAYDPAGGTCRVYGQPIKPAGCSDFPVYVDGDVVMADLRCEAVDMGTLITDIAQALGPAFRIVQSADEDYPFLVSLFIKRQKAKAKKGKGR